MAETSSIEWTDATWNPVTGCQVVSPGCANCYAMRLAGTRLQNHPSRAGLTQPSKAGPVWNGQVRFNAQWLDQPLRWKRPRRIFVCAHGDLFADGVEDAWIDQVFAVMALSPQHTFQVLTKRPERMREYLTADDVRGRLVDATWELAEANRKSVLAAFGWHRLAGEFIATRWPLPNVWLGVSAEDQVRANERIPQLLTTPAAVRFVSIEPLLGPVDLTRIEERIDHEGGAVTHLWESCLNGRRFDEQSDGSTEGWPKLDWVIVGGESGDGARARPMHPHWVRQIRIACADAGVPFFFKQWGAWEPTLATYFKDAKGLCSMQANGVKPAPGEGDDTAWLFELVGKKAAGRLLDGVEHNGMPA